MGVLRDNSMFRRRIKDTTGKDGIKGSTDMAQGSKVKVTEALALEE